MVGPVSVTMWIDLLVRMMRKRRLRPHVSATFPSMPREIKSSSRLRYQHGVFYLSTPLAVRHPDAIDTQ